MKSLLAQMHLASVPQSPIPPARNCGKGVISGWRLSEGAGELRVSSEAGGRMLGETGRRGWQCLPRWRKISTDGSVSQLGRAEGCRAAASQDGGWARGVEALKL